MCSIVALQVVILGMFRKLDSLGLLVCIEDTFLTKKQRREFVLQFVKG